MKRFATTLAFALAIIITAMAQGERIDRITLTPMEDEEGFAQLDGMAGVMFRSAIGDLVISVTNADNAWSIKPLGIDDGGQYFYQLTIDHKRTTTPRIVISRMGRVDSESLVVEGIKPDYNLAYLVEELPRPIRKESLNKGTEMVQDKALAQVELQTAIDNLHVDCPADLGATIDHSRRQGDGTVSVTTITIPVANINSAKQAAQQAMASMNELNERLIAAGNAASASEWEKLDQLEAEANAAEARFNAMTKIAISAEGSNVLTIDVSTLGPRRKDVYGILLVERHDTVFVGAVTQAINDGGKSFANRKYKEARKYYVSALENPEAPISIKPAIQASIARCDTCIFYERLTAATLKRMKEEENLGQPKFVEYASAAIEFLGVLNANHPHPAYDRFIAQLQEKVDNLPLEMRFTITKWEKDYSGFHEGGPMAGVEMWAYYGTDNVQAGEYKTDRKFRKLTERNSSLTRMETTSADGIVDLQLKRDNLPRGFFFRPIDSDGYTVEYIDMQDVMRKSTGTYTKRQYRLRMYNRD